MENETLEIQRKKFNDKDYNNRKAILGFIVDKSRGISETCEGYCEPAYKKKYCELCNWIIENQDPPELYKKINQTFGFKLEI